MSDTQPPTHSEPDEIEFKGGWKKPTSARETPAPPQESTDVSGGGWRVPAIPPEFSARPARIGTWHQPKPEDTRFSAGDEIEIPTSPARPEDSAFFETLEEETAEAVKDEAPLDSTADLETYSGLGDLVASLTMMQPKPETITSTGDEEETAEAKDSTEDSDEFGFGPPLAERDALSKAAQNESTEIHPADYARQQIDLASTEEDKPTEIASDPAAYARQQLEALQSGQVPQVPATEPEPPQPGDAAAYARQQIAQLAGSGTSGVSTTEPDIADPAQVELARKFQQTERQVRALRQQYQNGQLTRDQLQQQLRNHLILDTEDNWWMMGVDTDTWYRYDNTRGDWVIDTPPVQPARSAPTATSQFTASDVLAGQLPYLPEDEEQRTGSTGVSGATAPTLGTEPFYVDPDMPLPRSVPINDPEATIPGNVAINQNTTRLSDADTMGTGFGPAPTLKAEPVQTTPYQPATVYDSFDTIAAQPPSYEAFDSQSQIYEQAVERQRQATARRLILIATLFVGSAFIIGTLLVLFVVVSYNNMATRYRDQIAALENYQPDFQTVRVLDAAGNPIAELNSEQGGSRESIKLSDMSPELIYAIVGEQDPNYYETPGFDTIAILAAFIQSLGGSAPRNSGTVNITQQIADLVISGGENPEGATWLDQIVVASEIARQYDKNFILELYLNEQFFGNQSYGVEAASQFYFSKHASEVNLVEGAMLASLLRNPVDNDPVPKENRDKAFAAADNVLRDLATVGCLNFQHAQFVNSSPYCIQSSQILRANGSFTADMNLARAQLQTLPFTPRSVQGKYPHFVDFVRRELTREYGNDMFQRGFVVRTTLVPDIQTAAENALRDQLRAQGFTGLQTGAVMVTRPDTGEVLAMVGSPNFNDAETDGQTNHVLTWQLPGSTIMPIVYARAMEGVGDRNSNGKVDFDEYLTAASVLFDLPRDFQDPSQVVAEADGQYRGAVSVRRALANSLNVPAIKTYNYIGNDGFLDVARRMGLTFLEEPPVLDSRTGVGEVTKVRLWDLMKAYGVLANAGGFVQPRIIAEIRDSDNQVVDLPESLTPKAASQVISPQVAFLIQNILSDSQFYDSTFAPLFLENYPGRTAAKMNNINDNKNMWTVGFSRNIVVGVWMGRIDDNATIANSRDTALPVWRAVMQTALNGSNPAPFNNAPANLVQPGSVQNLVICVPTGTLPADTCTQQRNELFAISNPPPPPDQGPVTTALIDSWTRQIANEFCKDNAIQASFVRLVPPDPYAVNWLNTTAGRPTANLMGLPQNVQSMPTSACELNTDLPVARIASPTEGTVLTGNVSILGAASATRFDSYTLEYAQAGTTNFTLIAGPVRTQQPNQNAVLAEWNTTTIQNGQYILRLTMNSTSGGFVQRSVNITLLNPTPTPVVIPTTAIPAVNATATTIPFFPTPFANTPQAQFSSGATPTATLFFGG